MIQIKFVIVLWDFFFLMGDLSVTYDRNRILDLVTRNFPVDAQKFSYPQKNCYTNREIIPPTSFFFLFLSLLFYWYISVGNPIEKLGCYFLVSILCFPVGFTLIGKF